METYKKQANRYQYIFMVSNNIELKNSNGNN